LFLEFVHVLVFRICARSSDTCLIHGSYGHGKSWNFSKSWKVMENGESHGKVMEF